MNELYNQAVAKGPAAASAKLTYRGGPLLSKAQIQGVFIDGFSLASEMDAFLAFFPGSSSVAALSEYNVAPGSYLGSTTLKYGSSTPPPPPTSCDDLLNQWLQCLTNGSAPTVYTHKHKKKKSSLELPHRRKPGTLGAGTQVTDSDIQKFLADSIIAGSLPVNAPNMLYVTYWPSGYEIVYDAQDASCQQFCGYHSAFQLNGQPVYYAVLPFPDCAGCTGPLSQVDALTSVTSHEICEALTDPDPGTGWYDDTNGEIGDICAWKTRVEAGHTVQLEWSNKAKSCR